MSADPKGAICLLGIIDVGKFWSNTCLDSCVAAGGRNRGCEPLHLGVLILLSVPSALLMQY